MRRPTVETAVTAAVVVGAAVFVFLQLQPHLIFAATTPSGGDMGAHVWGPAYLRDHLLPHGRITGWTPDWYAGFPALHFYFPLPSLLIVLLDLLLPYGVAFKLVTVIGLISLPAAAATLGRCLRLPFPAPALMAAGTVLFVFDRFHTIWGGNAAATLAGEFSFSISLSLALFFLAALASALETGKGRALAGVLLALTALCHLLPAAFAVGAAGVLLLLRRPDRARWGIVLTSGLVGLALASFWFLPFMARLPYSNDMGWERTGAYVENLLPFLRTDDAAPPATTAHLKVIFPLAALGALVGVARRRRGAIALTAIAAACGLLFRFVPDGPIWNARFLPFWYLCAYLLAGLAVAELALVLQGPPPTADEDEGTAGPLTAGSPGVPQVVAGVCGLLGVILLAGVPLGVFATGRLDLPGNRSLPFPQLASADSSFVPAWARWNYSGYEGKRDYPEFREVITTMDAIGKGVGCGRAMWEYEPELNRYGTPMALMLLPYFTNGCIGSMEGLFFESSATVPYHFLNQSELSRTPSRAMRDLPYRDLNVNRGVEHLKLLGVRYYMALSPEAQAQASQNPDLELVGSTAPYPVSYTSGTQERFWQIYEVRGSDLVAPLAYEPVVFTDGADTKHGCLEAAVAWYQDPSRWEIPLASDGPADWARIRTADDAAAPTPVPEATVTSIRHDDDGVSFDVDRPGTPVVVKASYFPNWKADGARGPWRITPNLMVVVPTERHVSLHYGWTPVDLAGWGLTALGLLAAVFLARRGAVKLPARRARRVPHRDPFFVERTTPAEEEDEAVLTGASRT